MCNLSSDSVWPVVLVTSLALFLDNVLLTAVVPIIPEFLYNIRHREDSHLYSDNESDPYPPVTTMATLTVETNFFPEVPGNPYTTNSSVTVPTQPLFPKKTHKSRHEELIEENVKVRVMFASKTFVELLANLFAGPLTTRIGYRIPMFTSFIIMFISTMVYAFGRTYGVLFVARALQGIGSSCSMVSGLGMLAERFPNDQKRGNAMGVVLGALALGLLIGPSFGGMMYSFVGIKSTFLVLAFLVLCCGLLQLLILRPRIVRQEVDAPSLKALLMDPYILVAAGAMAFASMSIAMLESTLPIWMMDSMNAPKWQLGAAFLPVSILYLIGNNICAPLGHSIGRWLAAMIGLLVIGICLIIIPFSTNIYNLVGPNAGLGFAIGMVHISMMPQLGSLVDKRHAAVYGSVYAIGNIAICLGFAFGPTMGDTLVETIGFEWMLVGIAIINFIYAPLLLMLRSHLTKEMQKRCIVGENPSARYVHNDEDQDELENHLHIKTI